MSASAINGYDILLSYELKVYLYNDFIVGAPNGFRVADDRPLHLVKKVSVTDKGWTFELHDAQTALISVLKLHGKFIDRVAIESELQAALDRLSAKLSPDEYAKIAAILTDDATP